VIRVGRDMEHSTLKSALAVANDYDRIEVYPGIYDEQFEMSSKIPFELIDFLMCCVPYLYRL
jgi:F-box protein 10